MTVKSLTSPRQGVGSPDADGEPHPSLLVYEDLDSVIAVLAHNDQHAAVPVGGRVQAYADGPAQLSVA